MSYIFVTFRAKDLCDPVGSVKYVLAIVLLYDKAHVMNHPIPFYIFYLFLHSLCSVMITTPPPPPSLTPTPPRNASWHIFLCHFEDQILYVYLRTSLKQTC